MFPIVLDAFDASDSLADVGCELEETVSDVYASERTGDEIVIQRAERGIERCVEGFDPQRIWWYRAHTAINRRDYEGAANDLSALVEEGGAWADDAVLLRVHVLLELVEQRHGAVGPYAGATTIERRPEVPLTDEHAALVAAADRARAWSFPVGEDRFVPGLASPRLALIPILVLDAHGDLHAARERIWTLLEDPSLQCSPDATRAMALLIDGYAVRGRHHAAERVRQRAIEVRSACRSGVQ